MKEEINFSPKVVIFEDGGSLAPNIPSPYKFNGTKIFRDTTALPFQKGGPLWGPYKDKKEEQAFQKFYNTLPDNLMQDDPEYDIRGYWDSEGRPEEFNYNQPKEEGYYHASSINGNTGEYLKSPTHPTFQHAIDEDRKMGYRPITNVYGRNIATKNESIINPEEQSFLRNTVGPTNFLDGGPLVEKTNHGKLLNSIYASDLGPYHYDSGGPIKSQNGFIPYKRYDLFDNSLKNGGQFSGSYSLPEDSFRQGGNNLHNSVYASSAGQYPAIYAAGGIMPDPGDITCPDGYTYNPETHDCEKASTTCPEGYQYNPNTGECDSLTKEWQMKLLGAPAKYNIDNTGDKYKVTDPDKYIDSEMTELTPEQLRTVQEETDGKNAKAATNVWPKDFKIKQMVDPLYIAESGTHTITNPNYVNSQESQNWYNHATFPKIPDLNYKVVIDPTKTEGYNKEENIYYVNSENTHQAKKYKEWQILKDLETKSLEDAKKYGFTINSKDNETKLIQQLYNNPEYLGDTASNTSYEELFKDRAKKEEEHWKKICPDCTYKHGINYSVDPNYIYRTLDPTNLVGPEDYFTKILTTEKVDHTKPDKERIKGSMEMYENPDAPFYSPSDYDRRMPTLNIHDGKTRALKPDWLRDMQIGNNHYNRQRYYNFPKLEIGSREATKLIPKIVQKITGYDKDFMEGTTDDEGNYIPGEIDKAEQENRLINFKGASSIKDLINQKNYNEQSKNYKEELNTVRELNKNLLLEHGWDASSYKYGGGMSFANGGPSCPEGTQWDNDLKTCVKIGLNTLPQVNVSPWAVDMKAEQPTQVSNVLQNLVKKNESNNLKFPGLEPNFNYGPSDAIQSSDWMWQLPIAGKGIGQGIKALGELGGMAIPGLSGTTLGNAVNAGFASHGLTNLAMNSSKELYDLSQGKGNWDDAALNAALYGSELIGSGIGKGALNLGKGAVALGKTVPKAIKDKTAGMFYDNEMMELSNTLAPAEASRLGEISRAKGLQAYKSNDPHINQQFVQNSQHLSDADIFEIYGKTRKAMLKPLPPKPVKTVAPVENIDIRRNNLYHSVPADVQTAMDTTNSNFDRFTYLQNLHNSNRDYINNISTEDLRNAVHTWGDEPSKMQKLSWVAKDLTDKVTSAPNALYDHLFKAPRYTGEFSRLTPSLYAREFNSPREMHNYLTNTMAEGAAKAKIGDVITGSTNTSHDSYLAQMDYLFKNAGKPGFSSPKYLGHFPMNQSSFLNGVAKEEEIFKSLNTGLNKMQNKTGINFNLKNAPYMQESQIMLPHYGLEKTGEIGGIIKRNGGELSHFYDSNIQAYNNGGNLYDNVLVFKKKI